VKWAIFALGLMGTLFLGGWLRSNPRNLKQVCTLIGALPFLVTALPKHEIAILGVPEWPGFARGFDVSVFDLFAFAVLLSLPRRSHALPFKLPFFFYIATILLSALQAPNQTATYYYAWQLLRIFMAYIVIARACADPVLRIAILNGMAFGLCFEGGVVILQRFVFHYLHVVGTFDHQNMLGLVIHFVIFPFFALVLSGQKGWKLAAIPFIGMLIDIITTSRGAIALALAGFSSLLILSMLRKMTPRKGKILASSVLILTLLSPLAYRQFELRYQTTGVAGYGDGRTELNNAAAMMLSDFPMGIGANNIVVFGNTHGYYERASVGAENAGIFPHNIYWATAAELGYIGLTALAFLLLRPLQLAFFIGWRTRNDQRGDLLLGLAVSLAMVYVQSYYEFLLLTDEVQYFFAIELGIIASLALELRRESASKHKTSVPTPPLLTPVQHQLVDRVTLPSYTKRY